MNSRHIKSDSFFLTLNGEVIELVDSSLLTLAFVPAQSVVYLDPDEVDKAVKELVVSMEVKQADSDYLDAILGYGGEDPPSRWDDDPPPNPKPKPTHSCECGMYAMGVTNYGPRHSSWCPMYRDREW